jgi:hypothetical protein
MVGAQDSYHGVGAGGNAEVGVVVCKWDGIPISENHYLFRGKRRCRKVGEEKDAVFTPLLQES